MTIVDDVAAVFLEKGESSYFGEPVSQLEHALQTAHFARRDSAPDYLIAAALLHDVGHLVQDLPEDIANHGIDARHEDIGESWLAERFGPEVYQPVRLHVAAKRYLCATDSDYLSRLSPASVQSLQLQGGPMTHEEVVAFQSKQYFHEALKLRLWDDEAKIPGLSTAALSSYFDLINKVAVQKQTSAP
jgi:phosphonate degradation associated HDIG domain protein